MSKFQQSIELGKDDIINQTENETSSMVQVVYECLKKSCLENEV